MFLQCNVLTCEQKAHLLKIRRATDVHTFYITDKIFFLHTLLHFFV